MNANTAILSNEDLRRRAPSVFATEPWSGVSSRFAFIPTIDVVESLREAGFYPVAAAQSRVRIAEKSDFTRHVLRFRRESDIVVRPRVVDGNAHHFYAPTEAPEIPEIVLTNAHDRSSAYCLDAGLFRLVCSNGLMVSSGSLASIHVRHTGDVVREVIEGSFRIIDETPNLLERVGAMKAIPLSEGEQRGFAKAAALVRWGTDEAGNVAAPFEPERLLRARRTADERPDLWSTFNRVQENLIRGGIRGRSTSGRRVKTRAVASVSEDSRLNKALWILAETIEKAKA